MTVSDCYDATEGDAGAYDLETDDRREDLTPSPSAGQFNAEVVELLRARDGWVVSGWSSLVDVECTPGETAYVAIP